MAGGNPDLAENASSLVNEIPADVAKVADDTGYVLKGFMYESLTNQIEKEGLEGDLQVADIPNNVMNVMRAQDDKSVDDTNKQQLIVLGKSLALQGDLIQAKYHKSFVEMIRLLNVSYDQSLAYERFKAIASRLFVGGITMGRILALFYFGFELALDVIKKSPQGIISFLGKLMRLIVQFVVKEQIACWIIRQGGWVTALNTSNSNSELWFKRSVAMVVILSISYGIFSYCKSNKS